LRHAASKRARANPGLIARYMLSLALRNAERAFLFRKLRRRYPNLPVEAAVEVQLLRMLMGSIRFRLGPLPDPITKLLMMQVNVQQLAVEAAVHGSKEIALQALLIDPVVNSAEAAVHILDELWEINRPYIRPCV
jgi:alpha-galactosidase/6-phospho-beta-glucosidase family protein